ncbi:MAG TPA: hypothetical protein VJ953_02575 [Saprospiraceae bacterium]|nr:hypothetical protein [Saprospiraceae bacterium]
MHSNNTLRRYFLLVLVVGCMGSAHLYAQDVLETPMGQVDNLLQGRIYEAAYDGVKGSQYLSDIWQEGQIELLGHSYSELPLLYDIFQDELVLLYRQPSSIDFIQLIKGYITRFILGQRLFINIEYSTYRDLRLEPGFYELLVEDSASLLIKRRMDVQPENSVSNFVRRDERYLIFKGKAFWIRRKGVFFKAIGDTYKKQVQRFMKENNIRLNKRATDSEWLAVIEYLNNLQTEVE